MPNMTRNLIILGVILVALIFASQLTERQRLATAAGGGFTELLDDVDVGALDRFEAWVGSAPDTVVALERTDGGWIVASSYGWPAKTTQIDNLVSSLDGLKGELRSSSADVLDDYAITEETGLHVVGKRGDKSEFHLVVGKNTSGGEFIRTQGSDDVYRTAATLRSRDFGLWGDEPKPPQGKRWIDLQIHKMEAGDVDKVELIADGKRVTLERQFEVTTPAAEPADSASVDLGGNEPIVNRAVFTYAPDSRGSFDKVKADGVINTLASIYAGSVVDPAQDMEALGFGERARVAEITDKDGNVTRILFGDADEDDANVYVMVEGGKPGLLYKGTVDRIFVDRADLSPGDNS